MRCGGSTVCGVAVADVAGRQRVAGDGRALAGVGLARGRHRAARRARRALRRAGRCHAAAALARLCFNVTLT